MTLMELLSNVHTQGTVKVVCWENDCDCEIFYEDSMDGGFPSELMEYADREVAYMFPYTFYYGKTLIAGICIELTVEDQEEI